jgi:hypothetical protein
MSAEIVVRMRVIMVIVAVMMIVVAMHGAPQ